MTVGQWLERCIREWTADGAAPPGHLPDQFAAAALLVDLAIKLAEASPKPEPGKSDPLLGTARGRVRALLTKLRPEG